MNSTDNAQTWRDLADQLTPQQIAELEAYEKLTFPPDASAPDQLLAGAQRRIRENEIQVLCADIPAPPDCSGEPSRWIEWDRNLYQRTYRSWRQERDGFTVEILTDQFNDGSPVERSIWLTYELLDAQGRVRDDMDAKQARTCGELLIAAADELDRRNGDSPPFT